VVDVRTRLCAPDELPPELLLHVGAATVGCAVRPLGADTARLRLAAALPLRAGDRVVLRHDRGVAGGAVVLDVDPPALRRRNAGRRRAEQLAGYPDAPDGAGELRRRGIVRAGRLRAMGIDPPGPALVSDWLVDPDLGRSLRARLATLVAARAADSSAAPLRVEEARRALDLPEPRLVPTLLAPGWTVRDGMIVRAGAPDTLATALRAALAALEGRPRNGGFGVLAGDELAALGLGAAEVAAAARVGRLVRLAPDIVLLPEAVAAALGELTGLPQPFTAGEARAALDTTRTVVVPLLEYLAQQGRTRRTSDGHHIVTQHKGLGRVRVSGRSSSTCCLLRLDLARHQPKHRTSGHIMSGSRPRLGGGSAAAAIPDRAASDAIAR
jgi:selenocysteine-specific elongation factor